MNRYPDECLFGDIFGLIHLRGGKPSSTKLMDPHTISFKQKAPCLTHGKLCPVPDFADMLALLGAPCVLFSRLLDNQSWDHKHHRQSVEIVFKVDLSYICFNIFQCEVNIYSFAIYIRIAQKKKWLPLHRLPRLGQKNGFSDVLKAQCHAVATAVMNHCDGSVHENVQGYDDSHLKKSCDHQVEMAVPLTWKTSLFNWWCTIIMKFEGKLFFSHNHSYIWESPAALQGWHLNSSEARRQGPGNTVLRGVRSWHGNVNLPFDWIHFENFSFLVCQSVGPLVLVLCGP